MHRFIKFLSLILLIILAPQVSALASDEDGQYYLVQEYFDLHPVQKLFNEEFAAFVHAQGHPPLAVSEPVRIAVVYPGNQVSDYWRRSIDSFTARLREHGIAFELDEHFTKPVVDLREQGAKIAEFLQKNPDYLVFTLDAVRHRRIIEQLLAQSAPRVILQNITTPLKAWEDKQPFLYVGFDHVQGSQMLARYFIRHTGGEGTYAVLFASNGYISTMRGNSFVDYVSRNSNLSFVAGYYTQFDREKARRATLDIISAHPNLKFIYACSTDIALGALDALRELGLVGKVPVNGWGGGSSELAAIQKGELDVTVMRINDDNGVAMADAIYWDHAQKSGRVPTVFSGDFALVDKNISVDRLDELKARAFRYSN